MEAKTLKDLVTNGKNAKLATDKKLNECARERLEQVNNSRIDEFIWIASLQDDEDTLNDFGDQLDIEDLKAMFSDFNESYESDFVGFIQDYYKLGFLCRALFPICSNFQFDEKGEAISWHSSPGHCRIAYFYAETPNGIIDQIEKHAKQLQNEFLELSRKETNNSVI